MADTLRGAFVSFMDTVLVPVPNVIVFQFNPETIEHGWTVSGATESQPPGNPLAVKGYPGESFSFTLALDANEMIAGGSPVAQGIAAATGVYTRIAALEMLLYPRGQGAGGLLGTVSLSAGAGGLSASLGGSASPAAPTPVPQLTVSVVLFVWGPGRIVPVRVTSLSFTEKLYDGLLNPTHVEAKIGLRVLTPDELDHLSGPLKTLCKGAYAYSQGLRQALATANLANSVESIIGMLPV